MYHGVCKQSSLKSCLFVKGFANLRQTLQEFVVEKLQSSVEWLVDPLSVVFSKVGNLIKQAFVPVHQMLKNIFSYKFS